MRGAIDSTTLSSMSALYRSTLLAAMAVLLAACAMLRPQRCEQFEAGRNQNTDTHYVLETVALDGYVRTLGNEDMAIVPRYRLKLDTASAQPCSHINIRKELVLLRRDNPDMVFEESREFFAEDGTRIAVKNEVLTAQLGRSGRYAAVVPLPIPRNAPLGKYRIASTLTIRTRDNKQAQTLARSQVMFRVVAMGEQ